MRWLIVPLLLASLVGCSKEEKAAPACAARKTIFCRCPKTGEPGWQTCLPDGSGYEECGPCDGTNLDPSGEGGSGGGSNTFTDVECGNGRTEAGEQCDDGNYDTGDSCVDCRKATCGDGFLFVGEEECDDGNSVDTDGCSNGCKVRAATNDKCPGDLLEVTTDPAGRSVKGLFQAYQPNYVGDCKDKGGGEGRDAVYAFKAPTKGTAFASVAMANKEQTNTVVYVREGTTGSTTECETASNQVACVNEGGPSANERTEEFPITKGNTYFVFVDTDNQIDGEFILTVRIRPEEACEGAGEPCDVVDGKGICAKGTLECQDGTLKCKPASPGKEVCGDDLDSDCDGSKDNGCPCVHDVCTASKEVPLEPGCVGEDGKKDECVEKVCAKDDYCCNNEWDDTCVGEVATYCGKASCVKDMCAHPICATGAALAAGCDGGIKCVEKICKEDPICCDSKWDESCIEKIPVICDMLTCE